LYALGFSIETEIFLIRVLNLSTGLPAFHLRCSS
jgi:hypothetical protein